MHHASMLSRLFHLLLPMAAARYIEPWYMAYALLGLTVAGVMPILLPLAISYVGSAMDVGLVMALMSLGGLLAPLWGRLADRHRLHRSLLVSGLVITALGLAVFPFTHTPRYLAWTCPAARPWRICGQYRGESVCGGSPSPS